MVLRIPLLASVAAIALLAAVPATAASAFVRAVDAMMISLSHESAQSSAKIRGAYQSYLELLMLQGYTDMEGALDNGGLVPLPFDPSRFNLKPRVDGPHPIGEKDLDNQESYIAARPATMGMLLEIASQVKSGPLEITSLVRHSEYQDSLRTTNANATTSVPMHTMGLAVDIALVNSSLKTVYEIRDVLRRMQRNGDILFIGERRQLVFHVVPHPSRLGHFNDVYMRKVGLPPTSRSAHVIAAAPGARARASRPKSSGAPSVTAEVLAIVPWAASPAAWTDAVANDTAPATPASAAAVTEAAASASRLLRRWSVLFIALLIVAWRITARPGTRARLFEVRA